MKILLVHNYYQYTGGEDIIFKMERDLLISHGHNVKLFTVSNKDIRNIYSKVRVVCDMTYSEYSKNAISQVAREIEPDIVHVHNTLPLLSPSIYDACHEHGLPIVQTLHNYRIICPGALLLRKGQICEICIDRSPYHAVLHKCYKNSRVGSFAVSRMVARQRESNGWNNKVDRYIALTEFAKKKFIQGGIQSNKIAVKSNFSDDLCDDYSELAVRSGAIFVGRISMEKGIDTLVNAWRNIDYKLSIAGDGPLIKDLNNARTENPMINILGRLVKKDVRSEMLNALFLIIPSNCYEGFPLVIAEAFSCGLPVVCSKLGSLQELIRDGCTGLHFRSGDAQDLAMKCLWLFNHPEECVKMSLNARTEYLNHYTPEVNYRKLLEIYRSATEQHRKSRTG